MPRHSVTLTDDLHAAVEQYRQRHGIASFAAALVELARVGLLVETGEEPPDAATWGGWRGSEKSLAALMAYTDEGRNDPAE